MKRFILSILISVCFGMACCAQVYLPIALPLFFFFASKNISLPIYDLKQKHDLKSSHLHFTVQDDRKSFLFGFCSDIEVARKSEFDGEPGVALVQKYCDTLAYNAGAMNDLEGFNIHVTLQVLSYKFRGFPVTQQAHGLCQIKIDYPGFTRSYCVDLKDDDPTSPFYRDDFLTQKSIIRIMVSGAVRDVVEKIIDDYSKTL